MTEPTPDPRSKARVPPGEIAERRNLEKITRTFRADAPPSASSGSLLARTREYGVRAVLSYHRFLGRWTAP